MTFLKSMLDRLLVVLLRDVARYRFNVIRANLTASFKYSSDHDIRQDIDGYYGFLAKIIRQIIARPTKKLLNQRIGLKPYPEIDHWLREGRSVIIVSGHVGNWEWSGMYLGLQYPGKLCVLYKKIKSNMINQWMVKRRLPTLAHLIETSNTSELLRRISEKPLLIMMIADQNPGSDKGIVWVPFFGRETAFINGPEKIADKYKLPVLYLHSLSTPHGGYQYEFELISNGKEINSPGDITKRYASLLEKNIMQQRTEWLWSHKRWKRIKNEG